VEILEVNPPGGLTSLASLAPRPPRQLFFGGLTHVFGGNYLEVVPLVTKQSRRTAGG